MGAYVVDKSNIHYELGGYQAPYSGIETYARGNNDLRGDMLAGYDHPLPTPADAATFGAGPMTANKQWAYVRAFAAPRQLVSLAGKAPSIGTASMAQATGGPSAAGKIDNRLTVGVIGQAHTWTEPLRWIQAQNFLYQTDAEENEGSGFAFANTNQGVPSLVVRGISDSPWHPNAYSGVLAARHAARVALYVATHAPASIAKAPVAFGDLSGQSNARKAGYIVADQAFFHLSPVKKVMYTAPGGGRRTLPGPALARLRQAVQVRRDSSTAHRSTRGKAGRAG